MKKTKSKEVQLPDGAKWFMVTDTFSGYVNGKTIKAVRGDQLVLTPDAAKLFKDKILEINHGVFA